MTCIIFEDDFVGSEKCRTEKSLKSFFDRLIRGLGSKFEVVIFRRRDRDFLLKTPHNKKVV